MDLAGADLEAAIRQGLARAGQGGFPQVAGLQIVWTPLALPENRLVSLRVREKDGTLQPIDPARIYRIVTNNFMRAGGDGYVAFRDHAINPYDTGPAIDVAVTDAIAARPFAPATDGRIAIR